MMIISNSFPVIRQYSTFGNVVATKYAVLIGLMRDSKLGQGEESLHLMNGRLHVGQPVGKKLLSKELNEILDTVPHWRDELRS